MASRNTLRMNMYFAIAQWLWGYSIEEMNFGPPERGMKDRFAMWIYNRGICIQHEMNGRCPECGSRR